MAKGGKVVDVKEEMYTADDAAKFKTSWTKVICKAGDVRISRPIPHGSTGPATAERMTALPWLVAVEDDGRLEIAEGGTWDELRQHHNEFTGPLLTPSGLPNKYGLIPFPFPAHVKIPGLHPLSDALVCRVPWDDKLIQWELRHFLRQSSEEMAAFTSDYRQRSYHSWRSAFIEVERRERLRFGDRSYFAWKDAGSPATRKPDPYDGDVSDSEYEDFLAHFHGPSDSDSSDFDYSDTTA